MEPINSVTINDVTVKVGDMTRYGIVKEFIKIDGIVMMRSDNPYDTWPVELIKDKNCITLISSH